MHHLIRTTLAAALLSAGLAAQAGVVKFEGWAHGNGNAVSVSSPGFSGHAGGFNVTLSGFSGPNALSGAFEAYCVDLYEHITLGASYTNYNIVSAATMWGADKVAALTELVTYVNNSGLFASAAAGFKDNQSTALQLAIWNIVYDTDKTLDSGAGATFSELTAAAPASAAPPRQLHGRQRAAECDGGAGRPALRALRAAVGVAGRQAGPAGLARLGSPGTRQPGAGRAGTGHRRRLTRARACSALPKSQLSTSSSATGTTLRLSWPSGGRRGSGLCMRRISGCASALIVSMV
jgi:hypothetical protein